MDSHAIIPTDLRGLRACLLCGLVKTLNQFQTNGCENCEEYLQMQGERDEVYSCTSANFDGIIAMMSPSESWVAKWQMIDKLAPGIYAISFSKPKVKFFLLLGFLAGSLLIVSKILNRSAYKRKSLKIVINTWPFTDATDAAFLSLNTGKSVIDSIVDGISVAENDLSIHTVGYGGSPDENGNTTLDALLMDGQTMEAGAVAAMPHIKEAIKVAKEVMLSTRHTLLVGEDATKFAMSRGFSKIDLHSDWSIKTWKEWRNKKCQPNFRRSEAWTPSPSTTCGPYKPTEQLKDIVAQIRPENTVNEEKHDTIGMIAFDGRRMAIGTSTNGASFRVPGRVGDTPIPGAGGYVLNQNRGAAVATGDGDILMRFLLSFQAATFVSEGMEPKVACEKALKSVVQLGKWYGAVIAMNKYGEYGGACVGFDDFRMSVRKDNWDKTETIEIKCIE